MVRDGLHPAVPHRSFDELGPRRLATGLVVAAFCTAFGLLHYGFYTKGLLQDTPLYERYGDLIVHGGKLPYRDFAIEYPPGAIPVFAAPSLFTPAGDFARYRALFEFLMLVCGGVASALVGLMLVQMRVRRAWLVAAVLLVGLAPLALGPVVLSRFDLWPAMLTIAGLCALAGNRTRLAAVLIGCAIAAKLYPAVLLPLAFVYVLRRYGRRKGLVFGGIAIATVLVWFLPFLALAPHGVWTSLTGQASRPLQIESLGASVLLAAHQLSGLGLTEVFSHGSDNLGGRLPRALADAQTVLVLATIVGIWIGFARGPATRERLLRYSAAAICAFVVFGKVLSPQYLVWLIMLVPLVRGRRGITAAVCFVGAMVLTQLWFPRHYLDLAFAFDARASWLVFARDLLLLAVLVALVVPPRAAKALVVALAAAAVAATGAGAARLATSSALSHSRLLNETGVGSTCARRKAVPATSTGGVRYALASFDNASGTARCVTVTLRAHAREELFSAAYLGRFDPAQPTQAYLGDLGRCTNIGGVTGSLLRYSFRVPAWHRFVVDVEQCSSGRSALHYTLRVAQSRGSGS